MSTTPGVKHNIINYIPSPISQFQIVGAKISFDQNMLYRIIGRHVVG